MIVDCYCSEIQYWAHLKPVWEALGHSQGTLFVAERLASALPKAVVGYPPPNQNVTLVASFQDSRHARRVGRKVVYLEHGAGQTYNTDDLHPSYSGGPEHEGTALFLSPREEVAQRWRNVYPDIPAIAIGSPFLDQYYGHTFNRDPNTVAISFHADIRWCPESTTAWFHYEHGLQQVIADLNDKNIHVLGHGHPRIFDKLKYKWAQWGAEPVEDWREVIERATVYAVDNSSTGYEALAVDMSTVWINAPWYRRSMNHGLRFWELTPGYEANDPEGLTWALEVAVKQRQWDAGRWRQFGEQVFGPLDGKAAEKAIAAIFEKVPDGLA